MHFDTYKQTIDQIKDYAIWLTLYSWGEPFLNKRIHEFVKYAHDANIATITSTNLNKPLSREMAENIIKSGLDVSIDDTELHGGSVDHKLLQLAADQTLRVLTTDYNLDKVAEIKGVPVLNLNEMASSLKPQVIPGETIRIEVVKRGEAANQGVGYLPDGTMVVIEEASEHIGHEVDVTVTNSLQTSAGRMIFARVA